jgi:hypothetical protein
MLNKAYCNLVLVGDAKDTADLFLELDKVAKYTVGVSFAVQILYKHRLHPVLGSSTEVGCCKQGSFVGLNWSELKVHLHLSEPIVKSLTVSMVEIGLGDLAVVA